MDEWMSASSVLVTKAGPGTVAEAAIKGLPVMLSTYLPGQEAGNVDFVKDSGFGGEDVLCSCGDVSAGHGHLTHTRHADYAPEPEVIASRVSEWLDDPTKLRTMREAALKAGRPGATVEVAREIGATALGCKTTWVERR